MPASTQASEFSLIGRIRDRIGAIGRDRLELGIGDDAALWRPSPGCTTALCCDTLIAGRHFHDDTDPADIGWKALAVNLSDLAAMGAVPVAALLALSLPAMPSASWLDGFCAGWAALANSHDVALAGGDTTRGPTLSLTVTCIGEVPDGAALRRDGARVGDGVYVSGSLGDAAAALAQWPRRDENVPSALIARLTRPTPRLALGQGLRGVATSAVDVSDGFAADLGHVLVASGVGADIDVARLPLSAELLAVVGREHALNHALAGGDDYELCFTASSKREHDLCAIAARTATRITRVGTITRGGGLTLVGADGRVVETPAAGWDHFA